MSWHPFERGKSYAVSRIVPILLEHLESGGVKDVRDKTRLVGLLEPYLHDYALFQPHSTGWGASPYNLSTWKKEDGSKLLANYNTERKRKGFSPKVRLQVIAKTGGYCYSCGVPYCPWSSIGDALTVGVAYISYCYCKMHVYMQLRVRLGVYLFSVS
jgi:hypothetical protein